MVAPTSRPRRKSFHFHKTRPITLPNLFPSVVVISKIMYVMFTTPMTRTSSRVRIRTANSKRQMTMFRARDMIRLLPGHTTQFTTRMAHAPRLRIMHRRLPMRSRIVPNGQFFYHTAARMFTSLRLPTMRTPMVVALLTIPPNMRPVATRQPTTTRMRLHSSVQRRNRIMRRIYFRQRMRKFTNQSGETGCVRHITSSSLRHIPILCSGNVTQQNSQFETKDVLPPNFGSSRRSQNTRFQRRTLFRMAPQLTTIRRTRLALTTVRSLTLASGRLKDVVRCLRRFIPMKRVKKFSRNNRPFPIRTAKFSVRDMAFREGPLFRMQPSDHKATFQRTPISFEKALQKDPKGSTGQSGLRNNVAPGQKRATKRQIRTKTIIPRRKVRAHIALTRVGLSTSHIAQCQLPNRQQPKNR